MELDKNLRTYFRNESIAVLDRKVLSELTKFRDKQESIAKIINWLGERSASAQKLPHVITTFSKLCISGNTVYIYYHKETNNVVGLLKMGEKKLFIRDVIGEFMEIKPLCVLDFYVHESMQRQGIGLKLFKKMLEHQKKIPSKLAYDRPSFKLKAFLNKHFNLKDFIPQSNNFVVFNEYFGSGDKKEEKKFVIPDEKGKIGNLKDFTYISVANSPLRDEKKIRRISNNLLEDRTKTRNECTYQ